MRVPPWVPTPCDLSPGPSALRSPALPPSQPGISKKGGHSERLESGGLVGLKGFRVWGLGFRVSGFGLPVSTQKRSSHETWRHANGPRKLTGPNHRIVQGVG